MHASIVARFEWLKDCPADYIQIHNTFDSFSELWKDCEQSLGLKINHSIYCVSGLQFHILSHALHLLVPFMDCSSLYYCTIHLNQTEKD